MGTKLIIVRYNTLKSVYFDVNKGVSIKNYVYILFKFLRPLPGGVKHAQNLDLFAFYSVWHDIGQSWNNQLQCPSHATRSAQLRVIFKLADGVPYPLRHFQCSSPVVSSDIVLNTL